ncbi:MAG: tryptophan--tRNA ligase [Myxococcota bacterium]|nr:tryptophan--tRNA ligase [Myxococcota bacterium]MDW8361811.1 tryptophan--tRNA ligase [Myxococcales bacterium]
MNEATTGRPRTALTGIKPTGTPHVGNFLGAIRPALARVEQYRTLYFIADYHALTTERDPDALCRQVYDVAATWLACGLDPARTVLFRQSDVVEVFELAWILACLVATGQLERGHAYKEALERGEAPNAGLFNYPVLMAADILLYDTDVVPIGRDQQQHLELTRDLAVRLNHHFGAGTVVVPEAALSEAPVVPGLDGRKMSKSYGNVIALFAPADELRRAVMSIRTSSEPLDAPKDPASSHVVELHRHFATPEEHAELERKLRAGGFGWGHAKEALVAVMERTLAPMRERYRDLRANTAYLDEVLASGALRARAIAQRTMQRVREAVGIGRRAGRATQATIRIKAVRP